MTKTLVMGWLIGISIAALSAAEVPSSDAFQTVCADLRAAPAIEADFQEDKTLHILEHPLHSTGTLFFSPSQGVYRVQESPVRQELLITRSEFVQKNAEGAVQRMSVRRQPAARAFVDVFLSFFSGDEQAWKKAFNVSFSGTVAQWKIQFSPREKSPAKKFLRDIVLEGFEGTLTMMTLTETNGDVTHTIYSNQHPAQRPFPSDLSAR